VREKSADLVQVIVDGCVTYAAFLREIFRERAFQPRLRVPRQDRSRGRNGARRPEVSQELLEHRTVAPPKTTSPSGAIAGEVPEPPFIHVSGTQAMSIKPAVQVSKKPELVPGVDPTVPLLEQKSREPVDVAGQWSTSETLDGAWMLKKPCRHSSFLRGPPAVGCVGR
jgi:hypothetical protein